MENVEISRKGFNAGKEAAKSDIRKRGAIYAASVPQADDDPSWLFGYISELPGSYQVHTNLRINRIGLAATNKVWVD